MNKHVTMWQLMKKERELLKMNWIWSTTSEQMSFSRLFWGRWSEYSQNYSTEIQTSQSPHLWFPLTVCSTVFLNSYLHHSKNLFLPTCQTSPKEYLLNCCGRSSNLWWGPWFTQSWWKKHLAPSNCMMLLTKSTHVCTRSLGQNYISWAAFSPSDS